VKKIPVPIRRTAISLAVVVAALALLLVFFSLEPGERIIKGAAEAKLSALLDCRIVIGRLETNLFSRLHLEDIAVYREADRSPSIEMERCTLEYGLSRLHRRSLILSSVDVEGLVVTITRDSSGAYDFPALQGGGDGADRPPISIELGEVLVSRSRIDYRDDAGNECGLADLDVSLSPVDGTTYRYRISIDSCIGTYEEVGFETRDVSAGGSFGIPFADSRLEASMKISSLDAVGLRARDVTVELSYTTAGIVLKNAAMRVENGSLSASGSIAADSLRSYTLSLELEGIDIPTVWRLLKSGPSPYEGVLAGRFGGAGRLGDRMAWNIGGEISVSNCRYKGRSLDEFSGRFDMKGGRLSIDVHQDYFDIAGEAALQKETLDGRFSAHVADLGPVAALVGQDRVRGALHVEGVLSGTLGEPGVRADIEASGVEYLGFPVDTIAGAVSIAGRSIALSGITFSGRLDDLGSLEPPLLIPELKGGLLYRGFANGAVEQIKAGAHIELVRASYRGVEIDSLRVDVFADWPRVEIQSMELRRDTLLVRGRGEIHLVERAGRYELAFFNAPGVDSLTGMLSLDGTLLKADSVELLLGADRLHLSSSLRLAGDDPGKLSFDREGAFDGAASVRALDLRLLEPFLPEGAEVGGSLSLDMSWSGTLGRIRPTGRISLEHGSAGMLPRDLSLENVSLEASIEDSVLVIDELTGSLQGRPFSALGKFELGAESVVGVEFALKIEPEVMVRTTGSFSPDSLGLAATIDRFDLALLRPYLSGIEEISGYLSAEIRADGPPSGPRLNGLLTARRLMLQPGFMAEPFDGGVVRVVFDMENIAVDSLLLGKGSGSLFVSGSVSHDRGSLRSVELTANADRLSFEKERSYLVSVDSARLSYKTQREQFLLDGDVFLGETRVLADFKPQSILPFVRSVERPVQEPAEFLERTRVDVRVRESDDLWIDNNVARIRLRADIGIIGSAARPNVTGRVSVVKGYVLFIDRKFKIEEGTVDFVDPNRLNPIIALSAGTRVTSYRAMEATPYNVTLSITGPLDEATVELYSEPALDRANIISLLTLGVTREQLTGGEEGGDVSKSGVIMDRAKALSSDRVGGFISRNVEDLLSLDQVTIEGNLFDFGSSWGPQLLASKKISDRTTMTYRTNVGHLNDRSIMLDYRLTKRFSLSGETDQYGRSGIDLKFTIRLR
jgi:autotransporter translocation and assembly factor TamB